ncbi:MAG: T9SS type A sorting domain-containing protein [Lewinellaceae bacterium]|nr:T9SS type A sorting domain-containing protein [Lewinellaceae bacterium]
MDGGVFTNSSGSIELDQNVTIDNGSFSNSGTITNNNGTSKDITLDGTSTFANDGTITAGDHDIILNDDATLVNNGTITIRALPNTSSTRIEGTGTFNLTNAFTNNGTIAPGSSIGTLTINGDFTNSGTLEMEIAGAGSFDQISVDGDAAINGNIVITFLGGFAPPMSGPTYLLVDASGNSTGTPAVSATNASTFDVTYSGGDLTFNQQAVLPISLLSFEGRIQNFAIHLHWRTATEQNNDYMAVERSADGIKYEELGQVKGAGTTQAPQEYSFVDEKPLPGLNYYRLRQVDFDGASERHKAISVLFRSKSGVALQVFPNPAGGQLRAAWPGGEPVDDVRLLNLDGRELPIAVEIQGNQVEIDLSGLPEGLYLLELASGPRRAQERVVVRR